MARRYSNVIAFDDAPFTPRQRSDVPLVGVVFAADHLDGVSFAGFNIVDLRGRA